MTLPMSVVAPRPPSVLPFWGLDGNEASPTDVLGTTNSEDLRIITDGQQRMVVTSDGNVGIGTTSPSGKLEVVGDIVVSGTVDGVDIDVEAAERLATDIDLQNQIDAEEAARIAEDAALQAAINAETAARIAADADLQADIDQEIIDRIADVDVEEAARIAADDTLQANIDTLAAEDALDYDSREDLEAAVATGFNIATISGNVGIGTVSPSDTLDVNIGSASGANQKGIQISGPTTSGEGSQPALVFDRGNGATQAKIMSVGGATEASEATLEFFTDAGAGASHAMTIDEDGNVGIGTTSPGAKLDVHVSSGGAATIGSVNSATGICAIAMGYGTTASGPSSTAMGYQTTASRWASTAMGDSTIASGWFSTAMGAGTTASGYASTTMGHETKASGDASIAMGVMTIASGHHSTAMGQGTTASGHRSTAMGYSTTASGWGSTAMGYFTKASSYNSVALGRYNVGGLHGGSATTWVETDPLFEIGIGTSSSAKANAVTVLKNGNVGIWTVSPKAKLHVAGQVHETESFNDDGFGQIIIQDSDDHVSGLKIGYRYDSGVAEYGRIQAESFGVGSPLSLQPLGGNVGIGTTSPTSPLHVVGLPVYANNAAAIAGGLTPGAFYRTGGDPDLVCVVH